MDRTPPPSRDRDPIEAVLYFLFENWVLLLSLPALAGFGAFVLTSVLPQKFTATLHIPGPPVTIAAFDELWRSPSIAFSPTIQANGSVEIRNVGESEVSARKPVDAMLVTVREIASAAAVDTAKRQAALLDFETRLIVETSEARGAALAAQAHAFALTVTAAEEVNKKASLMNTWAHNLSREEVSIARGSKRSLLFAVFGAFTLALVIAIGRWLWRRSSRS